MLIGIAVVVLIAFSCFLAVEAMKFGMCEKKWFVAGMCFGPVILPMFNVKRNLTLHKVKQHGEVRGYF